MKIVPINNTATAFVSALKTAVKTDTVKREIPTAEENPAAFALFTGIAKSEQFTVEAAYQAFAGITQPKQSD